MTDESDDLPPPHTDAAIARNVRIMRNARGVSAVAFAAMLDMGHDLLAKLDRGLVPFDLPLLLRIAGVLGTTPGRLVDGPVSPRMIDLDGIADQDAAALEVLAGSLRRKTGADAPGHATKTENQR